MLGLKGWPKGARADRIPDRVNQCGTVGVMSLRQLAPAPVYPKTKLFGLKGWPKGPARALSMVRLDVHQDDTWHIASSSCFAEVDIDALKLKPQVRSRWSLITSPNLAPK